MRVFPKRIGARENEPGDGALSAAVERVYIELLNQTRKELEVYQNALRYRAVDSLNALLKRLPFAQPVLKCVLKTARILWRLVRGPARKPRRALPSLSPLQHLTADRAAYVLARCPRQPVVSLVVEVSGAAADLLDLCLQSVGRQHYPHWELLIVAGAQPPPAVEKLLQAWTAREPRIRVVSDWGSAGAGNEALARAAGEFVGFLAPQDELTPDALAWVVALLNQHSEASWFYSDEDRIDAGGNCLETCHKPDFSPEHLLATPFTCRLSVFAASLLRELGGMRRGLHGAEEHDLALRAAEVVPAGSVVHIPRVLYHHRTGPAVSGQHVVTEALARRGLNAEAFKDPHHPGICQVRFHARTEPHVTIIIPTKNAADLVRACVESIHAHTRYPRYEVVVIDNRSDEPEFFAYVETAQREGKLRATRFDKPFNHSEMNNEVAEAVTSEFVVFVNNDVVIQSDAWLEQLVGAAQAAPSVAAVGALLFYPDGTIQHAGVFLGAGPGAAGNRHRGDPGHGPASDPRAYTLQEFSALTAALLLVRRGAFLEVGGFNAERYPTNYNDADLCLKLRRAGYRCLYNPMVRAVHHESKTRPLSLSLVLEHARRFRADWAAEVLADPFLNPNLARDNDSLKDQWLYPVERDFPLELSPFDPAA